MDGQITLWYGNGQKAWDGFYRLGQYDGLVQEWYDNGQLEWSANYKDGQLDGVSTRWHREGMKAFELNYLNGIRDMDYQATEGDKVVQPVRSADKIQPLINP